MNYNLAFNCNLRLSTTDKIFLVTILYILQYRKLASKEDAKEIQNKQCCFFKKIMSPLLNSYMVGKNNNIPWWENTLFYRLRVLIMLLQVSINSSIVGLIDKTNKHATAATQNFSLALCLTFILLNTYSQSDRKLFILS